MEVRRPGEEEKGVGDNMIQQLLDFSEQVPGSENGQLSSQDPDVREAVQAAQLHDQVWVFLSGWMHLFFLCVHCFICASFVSLQCLCVRIVILFTVLQVPVLCWCSLLGM